MFKLFRRFKEVISEEAEQRAVRTSFIIMLVASAAALVAAFTLSVEKIHLLQDPNAVLSCSVNLVINCSTVMQTPQASVFFGVPNSFFGLIAFSVLLAVSVAAVFGGARFNNHFIIAMNVGVLFGTAFAYWLFFNSVYVIQVLCPWCLLVTFSCTLLLAASSYIAFHRNAYKLPERINSRIQKFFAAGYHQMVVAAWVVILIALVFIKFGNSLFL